MIKIGLCGLGRMGNTVLAIIESNNQYKFTGSFSRNNTPKDLEALCQESEIIIDFSTTYILPSLLEYSNKYCTRLVVGTTGFMQKDFELMKNFAKNNAIFYSANMSLGVGMMANIAANSAKILGSEFDIVITDFHHRHKKDSPSGTSLMIANRINEGQERHIDFTSIRAGGNLGEHEVIFASRDEIITFKHQALNRELFAKGALRAAEWLMVQSEGLYSVQNLLK